MIKVVLASNNAKKIAELETLFSSASSNAIEILGLGKIGFTGDIVEDGTTFEENALIKASVPAARGYIGVADDSGLTVEYLGGAPGIYSARYAGTATEHADDAQNRQKLLSELEGVPAEQRTAAFVCTAAVVFPEDSPYTVPEEWQIGAELAEKRGLRRDKAMVVRGECTGRILTDERGNGGFGYDPLFYYEDFAATFAQIPAEQKNQVSHRGRAMREFTGRLMAILKDETRRNIYAEQ